ncbi:MAG: hypothetical protein SFX18_12260 [Pirellulales bacterium]|nr:hypothetical protein [Pirellulales bacterium]
MPQLLLSADIDRRLGWPIGKAERLAKRGKLPHICLPDGEIRFQWRAIRALLKHVKRSGGGK